MAPRKKENIKAVDVPLAVKKVNAGKKKSVDEEGTAANATGFPVVGIGASAGGLAAFEAFFSGMPADTDPGMAFVLVQHLAPDHKSILTELIQRYTSMKVFEVEDGMKVQPNCAYIIPPNRDMAFLNGTLQLIEPSAPRGLRLPIDFFFRSLAQDQHEKAICIVLSGTGSDGTLGVRAIKAEGGMVMVQNPASTEYDGMPRSVISTGLVDYELPPAEMASQLITYVGHAFSTPRRPTTALNAPETAVINTLNKIFILLRVQTGHDFSQYKLSTISRRIERRMAVQQIETIESYFKYSQRNLLEVDALFRDLLIGVTGFFRDPEAFQALEQQGLPKIFEGKSAGAQVRAWSPGCSTGEEAYSLAILLAENQEVMKRDLRLQVFATDIDRQAIETARAGLYPAGITTDISSDRLTRFFSAEPCGGAFRIHKSIRDMLVFSEQDVVKDPPFSRLDLISCRNLLIYMGNDLQKKLIPLFHYALNPGGILFLGTSETVGEFTDLFSVIDRKQKLYQRKEDFHGSQRVTLGRFIPPVTVKGEAVLHKLRKPELPAKIQLRELTEQMLLLNVNLSGALVNSRGDILYLHGRTGIYLEPPPGETTINNILKMAREGLRRELTVALREAVTGNKIAIRPDLRVEINGGFSTMNLTVRPVEEEQGEKLSEPLYLVSFEEVHRSSSREQTITALDGGKGASDHDQMIQALKKELQAKEEYLQSTNEELETINEELKSSNEEMQSVNEELQSTNEELETSQEELQSVNEELATVNSELQTKVADLSRVNSDMNNLLAGTGIATVFVDHSLRILRFTPSATRLINLIISDVGRPVGHIVSNLVGYEQLVEDVQTVLDTLCILEIEVKAKNGAWYTMRIQPYRTLDNVIEGAVITFIDITEAKHIQDELRLDEERIRIALQATPTVIANQNRELQYTWVSNSNFYFSMKQVIGKTDGDFLPAEEAAAIMTIKRQVLESGKGTKQEIHVTIDGKPHRLRLNVEPLYDVGGAIIGITCAMTNPENFQPEDRTDTGEEESSKK